jgi:hypothetical protein
MATMTNFKRHVEMPELAGRKDMAGSCGVVGKISREGKIRREGMNGGKCE